MSIFAPTYNIYDSTMSMLKQLSRLIFTLLLISSTTISLAQTQELNLDFEKIEEEKPSGWNSFGNEDYLIFVDREIAQNGSNAAVIEYQGEASGYKALSVSFPAKYTGRKITLTGYIKTENVRDGYAGLWMRIDPSLGFDNMNNRGITGTTDWKQYEIKLDLKDESARTIVFGGLLTGKGKVWIDNLKIKIDGKSLEEAPLRPIAAAEKDTAFDKGSGIVFPDANPALISKLEILGRIWGFLKYHHPALGKGAYNWDYELFRLLPQYLTTTESQKDAFLLEWIDKYGEIETCTSCKNTPEDAFTKTDLSWISTSGLSAKLQEKLLFIRKNRHQGNHYYISMAPGVGNPNFTNENAYASMAYPDEGFRLLTLFKYWNMIQYFFPYKHLMDKDWNKVLAEYIPRFLQAKNEWEYEIAALQLIGDIQDTHANLWGGSNAIRDWKGNLYPPVHVRFIEGKLVITDIYNEEHKESLELKVGDIITQINGKAVEDILQEKLPYYPASNYPTQLRDISIDMLRSNDSSLQVHYVRDADEKQTTLPLSKYSDLKIYRWFPPAKSETCYKLLENNIGYITLQNIKQEDISEIKKQFKDAKGIIIDIRNYPSTFVPFSLGSFFTPESTPFVKFTSGNVNNPGEFTMGKPIKIARNANSYQGKVVVLLNEFSQSQAEYTAMAFRAGKNTTILGSTTAGADGNISNILLPGGLSTTISGIGVYYPDGTETQRVGIVPDIEVKPTIKGIREGRDELLEKAIEVILEP